MQLEDITDEIRQAFRSALRAKLHLWAEVGKLEKALGFDFDSDQLDYLAVGVDDVNTVTDQDIVQTINDDNG